MVNLPDSDFGLFYYCLEWAIRIGALVSRYPRRIVVPGTLLRLSADPPHA